MRYGGVPIPIGWRVLHHASVIDIWHSYVRGESKKYDWQLIGYGCR